jgi:hypothetical protein
MVKAQLAIVGLYALASLLIWTAFYAWHWWATYGQYISLLWVIFSSAVAAFIIFHASVYVFQIVDKWYFMRKAKKRSR